MAATSDLVAEIGKQMLFGNLSVPAGEEQASGCQLKEEIGQLQAEKQQQGRPAVPTLRAAHLHIPSHLLQRGPSRGEAHLVFQLTLKAHKTLFTFKSCVIHMSTPASLMVCRHTVSCGLSMSGQNA